MKNTTLSRRRLLKTAGLCAAAHSLMPELRNPAYAAGNIPKMFLMFYSYHGTIKSEWGSGNGGLTLGPLLSPLQPFKDDIVLVSDLNMRSAELYPGNPNAAHIQGQVHSLTSMKPPRPIDSEASRPVAGGPSIDQAILELLKQKNGGRPLTAIDSLQLGIADGPPGSDQMLGRAGYRKNLDTIVPLGYISDPRLAFNHVFRGFTQQPSSETAEQRLRGRRRLMAGFAKGQFDANAATISNLYGTPSRQRFESHADHMAALEQRLKDGPTSGGGGIGQAPLCIVPNASDIPSRPAFGWAPTLSEYMPKIAHLALACGRTRFATIAIEATVDPDSSIHQSAHDRDYARMRPYYVKVAEQVAKTLKLLKDSPTPDGKNLLYHTLFLWAGECGDATTHSFNDLQWMIGGQAGGDLQTGRFINAGGRSNADLFVSLGKLMDSGMTTFGDPAAVTGPMSEVKA